MEMQMCARCKKRLAVVFITRMENNQTVNEGLCLRCARELGIKPVSDMLNRMGLDDEAIEKMNSEMTDVADSLAEASGDDGEDGGAPAVDLPKIFQNLGFPMPQRRKPEEGKGDAKAKREPKRKFLSTYCQNLTERAKQGKIDRIVGRDRELARVVQILCRRQKNNSCLIGEPGVGKTAIAEALAVKIVDGDVPLRLRDSEVWLVDLTALVAGTQFRGQFESRILGLINEVKEAGNIILVIDEVHNIAGAGDAEGSMNAANILKPALSRGEIQVIGATTMKEYRKYIEKDSALERRFQPVIVGEPSVEDTVKMLGAIRSYYENYHHITIPDAVLEAAARLSERYITDRFLPDKAIDLIDEAAAHVALSSTALSERAETEKALAELTEKKTALEAETSAETEEGKNEELYKQIADLRVQELQLNQKKTELDAACASLTVTENDLADVIEIWTGIPATEIRETEFAQLDQLETRIKRRIVGQDEAVSAVVRAIRRKRAGVSVRRSPVSMIFAGPTGVGKTELVKVLAADLFKQPDTLIRLDMSEYMEKHSVSRIIGAPPGYVGFDEAGQLTEKIRRRPYSVVLFDEIEKAHPDVLNVLLQILDDGRVTDATGRTVNFENTVIIMTTNAGSDKSSSVVGFSESADAQGKTKTENALSAFLRPEFLNRVDEIITFRSLDKTDFVSIASIMLNDLKEVLDKKGIRLTWDDAIPNLIAEKSYSLKFGARNMRRFMETGVEDPIANRVIANYAKGLVGVHLSEKGGEIAIDAI
ncbi:MAG: ATP-dependent Clp protease ATP-binding subunit [Clostridia bacterium]|nr:ATP-dependent Clp protease ATP-binding subunit [Clostridia bacterium]